MKYNRLPKYARNSELESVLNELNSALSFSPNRTDDLLRPQLPTLFIVGCPRSGSTLLMQLFAASGCFGYISNLASRVWSSPKVAALLQRALLELDTTGEIIPDQARKYSFQSNLGKTKGALEPHEYWNFWRRFITFDETPRISSTDLEDIDIQLLIHNIAEMEGVFSRPMIFKGMIFNWHIPWLTSTFDNSLIIYITRDVVANACSLLNARMQFYGNFDSWYSCKPLEYEKLMEKTPEEQVAAQVVYNNQAIVSGLDSVSNERKLEISYEQLCREPKKVWEGISMKIGALGYELTDDYTGPDRFDVRSATNCENEKIAKITEALKNYI